MSANCKSCGKMMARPEDFSAGDINSQYCSNCTNADGSLKTLDEITLHIANQLIMSQGIDREAATKAARSILSAQLEWQNPLSKQDAKKLRKQKLILISTSVAVTAATIFGGWLIHNIKWPEKELFKEIKPVITTTKPGNVEVTQVSFPGNQYSVVIDENDSSINFSNGRYPYRFYPDEPEKGFSSLPFGKAGILTDNSYFIDSTTFIGSLKTNGSNKSLGLFYGKIWDNQNLFTSQIGKNAYSSECKGHVSNIGTKIINKMGVFSLYRPISYNLVFAGKYIAWIGEEPLSPGQYTGIVVLNTETDKTMLLALSSSNVRNLQTNGRAIFWEDYNNINEAGFQIKGFDLESMSLIETPINGENSLIDNNHLISCGEQYGYANRCIWRVVNEEIFFCDYDSYSRPENRVYNYKTKVMLHYNTESVLTLSEKFEQKSSFDNSKYYDHYSLGGMLTPAGNDAILWLTKDADGKYVFLIGKASEIYVAPTLITTNKSEGDYVDYVGTTIDWLVWKSRKLDRKNNGDVMDFELYATNIKTNQTFSIGKCNENFYSSFDDITVQNGIVAWSSITDKGDTDVFFARLPEDK